MEKLHDTQLQRNARGNWYMEDHYRMPDGRALQITTTKVWSGEVVTRARGVTFSGGIDVFIPYIDYIRCVLRSNFRCTERTVRELHSRANPEVLMAEALSFYEKQKAENATH